MATREQMIEETYASPEHQALMETLENEHWHVIAHLGLGLGWHRGDYRETITRSSAHAAEVARKSYPAKIITTQCYHESCLEFVKD